MHCQRVLNKQRCVAGLSNMAFKGNLARPSDTPKDIPARAPVYNKPKPGPIKDSTSFYCINPNTKTETQSHDVKAASITKALYVDTLPGPIAQNYEINLDNPALRKAFRKTVFESFFFEPTERTPSKPKRDRKPNTVIANTVLTDLTKMLYHMIDHSKCDIIVDKGPVFEQSFSRPLPELEDPAQFLIKGTLGYNILSSVPLMPFFDIDMCLQTKQHKLFWDDIIHTTMDIDKIFRLEKVVPGRYAEGVPSHPYIRTILDTCDGAEWDDTSRARGIYFLFARLASEAIRDGAVMGKDLRTPKCGVYISTSAYSYHYVFYQLNTLALDNDEGIKNLAWGHSISNITGPLVPYRMVMPQDLLGPQVLDEVMDYTRAALFYQLPLKTNVNSSYIEPI